MEKRDRRLDREVIREVENAYKTLPDFLKTEVLPSSELVSAYKMLEYASANVPLYSKKPYLEAVNKAKNGDLEEILKSTPIIDGSIFLSHYDDLIPLNKTPITVYFSSGSTGKPKPIPRTYDQDIDYARGFIKSVIYPVMPNGMDIEINKGPPLPAISGRLMSVISMESKAIEFSQGPAQTIADLLRVIEKFDSNHSKNILMLGFPSAVIREIYNLNESDKNYLKDVVNKLNLYVLVGGETLPYQRAKLLYNLLPSKTLIDFIGSSEGIVAYRVYTREELENDLVINKPFRFVSYNNLFMIKTGLNGAEKLLTPKEAVGLEGELVITTKAREGAEYVPLINYNTKDLIKVTDVAENGDIMGYYIGRADGIKRFGVGKLVEEMIVNTISDLINRYKVGEGYSVITRENGLDKATFYLDRGQFSGDPEELTKTIKSSLSSAQMEIAYSLEKELATIHVELLNKDSIPFYKDRGKSKWLIDKREV